MAVRCGRRKGMWRPLLLRRSGERPTAARTANASSHTAITTIAYVATLTSTVRTQHHSSAERTSTSAITTAALTISTAAAFAAALPAADSARSFEHVDDTIVNVFMRTPR